MDAHSSKGLSAALVIGGLVLIASPALALELGDWPVRARVLHLRPLDDGGGIGPDLSASRARADGAIVPEFDLTYAFTENLALELVAAIGPHGREGEGAITSLEDIAQAWLPPPTLTLEYRFLRHGRVRPYIGAGVNFILSFADDAARPADADLDSAWRPALQAGLDIEIAGGWFVNLDVTYLKIDSEAALPPPGPSGAVDIDPIVIGLGAGLNF